MSSLSCKFEDYITALQCVAAIPADIDCHCFNAGLDDNPNQGGYGTVFMWTGADLRLVSIEEPETSRCHSSKA